MSEQRKSGMYEYVVIYVDADTGEYLAERGVVCGESYAIAAEYVSKYYAECLVSFGLQAVHAPLVAFDDEYVYHLKQQDIQLPNFEVILGD